MPTYVYQVLRDDGEEGEVFEVFQKLSDEPLAVHPQTGEPVRRIPTAPLFATRYTDAHDKRRTSDKNLKSKGFTKYVKDDDGKYKKVMGSGPDLIRKPKE